ncbi:MAG: hypothetical protein AAB393_10920, partial [Bacteroidota bacterium]
MYNSHTGVVNSATIGIENATGTIGLQVVNNAPYLHNNMAILFTSDIITWMSTDRTSGTVAPGDSQSVQLRIHPAGLNAGLYTAYQKVTGNTPDTARVRVRLNYTPANSVTVNSPNGGEVWNIGSTYPITWTRTGAVDSVRIEYSTTGAAGPWLLIHAGVPAKPGLARHPKAEARMIEGGEWDDPNGTYNWLVPPPASTNCFVRVSWKANLAVNDLSNAAFTISTVTVGDSGWVVQTSGTTAVLYTVKAISRNVAWVAGAGGVVRRTTDGGATWLAAGTLGADVYTITALDGNTAIVGSYNATATRLHRTTNGGATWTTVDSIAGGFYDYVHMFDANNGYAMGDPIGTPLNWILKRTTNGGVTWTSVTPALPGPVPEAGWNNSMMWLDANNGWFGTNASKVYRTTNGGTNWLSAATNLGNANIFAVQFDALATGLVASQTGSMNRSTDGGA